MSYRLVGLVSTSADVAIVRFWSGDDIVVHDFPNEGLTCVWFK